MRPGTLFRIAALTTLGLVGAVGWGCSSSTSPAGPHDDGGAEAATSNETGAGVDAGVDCGFESPNDEAGCPATYGTASLPASCSPVGLKCLYPGQGDGSGCAAATAMLACVATASDGGSGDGGEGSWIAAQ